MDNTMDVNKWLADHAAACSSTVDYFITRMKHGASLEATRAAQGVLIWHKGAFIQAGEIAKAIESNVAHSQIYEQYEYCFFQDAASFADKHPPHISEIIMVACGFDNRSEAELARFAGEAVSDAKAALYG